MNRYVVLGATAAIVLALDQYTKYLVLANLQLYESHELLAGFLNIVHVRNPGAVLGILSFPSLAVRMVFFVIVAALALAFVIYYLVATKTNNKVVLFALSLVFAGALGNTIDRLRLGEVVDFIDCYLGSFHWPSFNIADSAISLGVVLLLVGLMAENNAISKSK